MAYNSIANKELSPYYETVDRDEVSVDEILPNKAYGITGTKMDTVSWNT